MLLVALVSITVPISILMRIDSFEKSDIESLRITLLHL